jgi:hypothetical protein
MRHLRQSGIHPSDKFARDHALVKRILKKFWNLSYTPILSDLWRIIDKPLQRVEPTGDKNSRANPIVYGEYKFFKYPGRFYLY